MWVRRNWLWLAYLLFVIILACAFFKGEDLDFSQRVNDQKISNFFTAVGAVAAAISIFFLAKQLEAMSAANASVYLPELVVEDTTFSLAALPALPDKPATFLDFLKMIENEDKYTITIKNIGSSAAKNINVWWEYDTKKAESLLKSKIDVLFFAWNRHVTAISVLESNKTCKVKFPQIYLQCWAAVLGQSTSELLSHSRLDMPPLLLHFHYKNIQGKDIFATMSCELHGAELNSTLLVRHITSEPKAYDVIPYH